MLPIVTVADFAGVTMQEQAELVQRLRERYETCEGPSAAELFRSLTGSESYNEHGQRTYSGAPSTTSLLVLRTVILSRKSKHFRPPCIVHLTNLTSAASALPRTICLDLCAALRATNTVRRFRLLADSIEALLLNQVRAFPHSLQIPPH